MKKEEREIGRETSRNIKKDIWKIDNQEVKRSEYFKKTRKCYPLLMQFKKTEKKNK